MSECPVCLQDGGEGGIRSLAQHFVAQANDGDSDHIRFLNQNLSRRKVSAEELFGPIEALFDLAGTPLGGWIRSRFIAKFYGARPHPFVLALQHPTRAVLLGYVYEHQHFLRQWVRSCAYIIARSDAPDVIRYELDNLTTEYGGPGPDRPSHYELLLRMGEAVGAPRAAVLATPPLPSTQRAITEWDRIAREGPWVAAVAAMHGLELIANRNLVDEGATVRYFDPAILTGDEIPAAARAFLREGYEADVGHSDEALALVEKYTDTAVLRQQVQATFLRSIDLFDDYLTARLERGERLASSV